jgi:hypothetical protein
MFNKGHVPKTNLIIFQLQLLKIIDGISTLNKEIENVSKHSYVILDSIQNISGVAEETAASNRGNHSINDEQVKAITTINHSSDKLNTLRKR